MIFQYLCTGIQYAFRIAQKYIEGNKIAKLNSQKTDLRLLVNILGNLYFVFNTYDIFEWFFVEKKECIGIFGKFPTECVRTIKYFKYFFKYTFIVASHFSAVLMTCRANFV